MIPVYREVISRTFCTRRRVLGEVKVKRRQNAVPGRCNTGRIKLYVAGRDASLGPYGIQRAAGIVLKRKKRKKQKDSDMIISRTQVLLDVSLPRDRFQEL